MQRQLHHLGFATSRMTTGSFPSRPATEAWEAALAGEILNGLRAAALPASASIDPLFAIEANHSDSPHTCRAWLGFGSICSNR